VVRKKFPRKQLLRFTANLQVELIGMEACVEAGHVGSFRSAPLRPLLLKPTFFAPEDVKFFLGF
jgi:hypothetical protein